MVDRLKMNVDPAEFADNFNGMMYLIRTVLRDINTVEVVRVEGVDDNSKTVTVIPIVKSANANGNPIPESPIYDVKYIQWQYGSNMIKAKPVAGDIGIIVICKKDISSINSGLIGSYREFSVSDGIYIGGIYGFNQEPTQIIEFDDGNGITITTSKTLTVNATEKVNIIAPEVNLGGEGGVAIAKDGDVVVSGSAVIGTIKASSTVVKSI